ncbi:alpha/beta hydrolase fold domain-containing protein [Duganella sp. FT80W]|uniref:Alpha/beta hydrolase fold domain-containing protein n=1 Tax=Duganella guangzhouensis TaxID=2666084 RepID=A0A6I2KU93_9BURK|nr:alpha/beta hydrolase [Duganella guangzhouensis]MRW89333.1 alpha/beta hydrolase fold domain-containing protein [Duganella guangzhouensis]
MTRRALLAVLLTAPLLAHAAGPLRDRIAERMAERAANDMEEGEAGPASALPAGVRLLANQSYGNDPRQRYDVYLPAHAERAPVIFMVHGGAWRVGDKANAPVVQNKVARWATRGIIVVSINYRMLPSASVAIQAEDVASALSAAQARAAEWGGDSGKFVLMGHSAGAHLVALLASSASAHGAAPWLGTVALDSAAMDVPGLMNQRHFPLYDQAFGSDAAYWSTVSPLAQLKAGGKPLLLVCSSRRKDSCPQADAYASQARALGISVQVLPQDQTHGQINQTLGQPGAYTDAVERFLTSLDPALATRLL